MRKRPNHSSGVMHLECSNASNSERGAALAIAILMMVLLSAIALGVLALVQVDTKIAGSDLKRTEACYASAAAIEKMTNDFSALFAHSARPSDAQLHQIELTYPTELTHPLDSSTIAYTFPEHTIALNSAVLTAMGTKTAVTMPYGPFVGLIAHIKPYTLTTTARSAIAQCKLTREMNNYLIPLFQFGMFSDEDIELHPGPAFSFNGRVHANGNVYVNGNVKFLDKVTTANEFIYDVLRNGSTRSGGNVSMQVGAVTVAVTRGSMNGGPNLPMATASPAGQQGYFPGSPNGAINTGWKSTSVAAANNGTPNQFGGQLLTRTTGGASLKLPLQLDNNPTRELIKRMMPNDSAGSTTSSALRDSRYHSKAAIRILIDDESPSTADASGIPAGMGLTLSTFDPIPLPNKSLSSSPTANGGGRALWRIKDNNSNSSNSYDETSSTFVQQKQNGSARQADTVRGVKIPESRNITGATKATPIVITSAGHGFSSGDVVVISNVLGNTEANGEWVISNATTNTFRLVGSSSTHNYTSNSGSVHALTKSLNGTVVPSGAGLTGRILIQIVDVDGNTFDVTKEILSMGITETEPNAVVTLQRPLWAAFTQGTRDASSSSGNNYLTYLMNNTSVGMDGEIKVDFTHPLLSSTYGLTNIVDDSSGQPQRSDDPPSNSMSDLMAGIPGPSWSNWNAIVPINLYNVREGLINSGSTHNAVYERGITSIVELNMRNLARWVDGVFDNNLLAGTNAVSTNIAKPDGYTVYVSDRRGDNVKTLIDSSGATINSSNGMVDNEDIYGPNGTLDTGEDVQKKGILIKDTSELPDPSLLVTTPSYGIDRVKRAIAVAAWSNIDNLHPTNHKYFRGAVRVFNGENLQVAGGLSKLSMTLGISVATENMVYIWGNYNTSGINGQPGGGSTLNDPTQTYFYLGGQVPASIVSDAFFPLSKTWFDAESSISPDDLNKRIADLNLPNVGAETSVRVAIIAGNNLSALSGTPDAGNSSADESKLNGGMHNFPRFLENWTGRWNFVGSLIPLYHSTQAMGQYNANSVIYGAPTRNWAFDSTFTDPERLPPSTPMFQYISPTAFRQVL